MMMLSQVFRRVPTLTFECPQGGSYTLLTEHSPELDAVKEKMFFVDDFVVATVIVTLYAISKTERAQG